VFRRIVSVLMVSAMLLATMVAPAFADSTRVCNNRCGDVDLSQDNDTTTTIDNSVDNSVDNSGQDNSIDNSIDNSGQTIDNSVDNTTNNTTTNNTTNNIEQCTTGNVGNNSTVNQCT
jgi:hypothetical protein